MIYPVDSVTQPLNNRALVYFLSYGNGLGLQGNRISSELCVWNRKKNLEVAYYQKGKLKSLLPFVPSQMITE